jgi:Rod binding domain-containing protein
MDPVPGPAAQGLGPQGSGPRVHKTGETLSPSDQARLRKAAQDFEAIFLTNLLKTMREATPSKGGVFRPGNEMKTYEGFMDEELGKSMARSGGIGLANILIRDLGRHLAAPKGPSSPGAAMPISSAEGPGGRTGGAR